MKKLGTVFTLLAVWFVAAAGFTGWGWYQQAVEADDNEADNEDDDIIGCDSGVTSIIIDENTLHGFCGVFYRVALFFANLFASHQIGRFGRKHKRSRRKAE